MQRNAMQAASDERDKIAHPLPRRPVVLLQATTNAHNMLRAGHAAPRLCRCSSWRPRMHCGQQVRQCLHTTGLLQTGATARVHCAKVFLRTRNQTRLERGWGQRGDKSEMTRRPTHPGPHELSARADEQGGVRGRVKRRTGTRPVEFRVSASTGPRASDTLAKRKMPRDAAPWIRSGMSGSIV